jgi:hypothetical protein
MSFPLESQLPLLDAEKIQSVRDQDEQISNPILNTIKNTSFMWLGRLSRYMAQKFQGNPPTTTV